MIVGALIVTIAFTLGFTIPGGYDGNEGPNQGTAILGKKAVFGVFMISDTIALLLSAIALVLHFTASLASDTIVIRGYMETAASLISFALGALMVSFVTGTYAVLERQSVTLAIAVCVISCCFFPVYFTVLPDIFHNLRLTLIYGVFLPLIRLLFNV
jgi:hypothetical protein